MKNAISLFVLVWVAKEFQTLNDLVVFLNDLRPGIASDAKIVPVDRKFHPFTGEYLLVYKAERP